MRFFALPLILLGLFFMAPSAMAATANHLVISQVQITGGTGKTNNDFIELYNPTPCAADLNGLRLVKRTQAGDKDESLKSWTSSVVIKAHSYYLWANSKYTDIPALPDMITSGTIAPDNGIALRSGPENTGAIIDSVAWGAATNVFAEGAAFASNPGPNEALERKPGGDLGNGEDSGNNANDFFLQPAAHPRNSLSPAAPPLAETCAAPAAETATSTPNLLVNPGIFNLEFSEILPNPKGPNAGAEWVEVYNAGSTATDLSGWYLDDGDAAGAFSSDIFQLPADTVVNAKSYLAITIPKGRFTLDNTGDTIWLFDGDQKPKLQQAYPGPAKAGLAYAKNATGLWTWTGAPTPGAANSFAPAEIYPVTLSISEVLPYLADDQAVGEYIELMNYGSDSVDLAGWALTDGRKRYVIKSEDFADTEIGSKNYFVLYRETTGIALRHDVSEELQLLNPPGDVVTTLRLEATNHEGEAYAWQAGNDYEWTGKLTPGQPNFFTPGLPPLPTPTVTPVPVSATQSSVAAPPVLSLDQVRQQALGEIVTTTGVIAVEPDLLGEQISYLAGSGLRLYFEGPLAAALRAGDQIQLTGTLATYHNELQLKVATPTVQLLNSGLPVAPHEIQAAEVGEGTAGWLVRISGTVAATAGDTFFVADGSGQARVHIQESTGIVKPAMKTGDAVRVTGLVSRYDDNYRLLPRYQNDLAVARVAGAKTENRLPRTGSNFWLVLAIFYGLATILLIIFAISKPKSLP